MEPYRSALAGRKPQTIRPGGGHLRPGLFLVADSIGEHHTDYFPMPAGDVVLASIAARTQRIRLGSADINAADWLALIGMNLDNESSDSSSDDDDDAYTHLCCGLRVH